MIKSGLYKIENIINHKFYIGSSKNIVKRISSHKCNLRKNRHHNKPLQHAFNKYDIESFKFEIIKYVETEFLQFEEQILLDKYFDSGILYNIFRDAYCLRSENHPMFNKHHTKESKDKIKAARSKQVVIHTEETKVKIGNGNKGKKVDKKHINKMIEARNGKSWNKGLKTGIKPVNIIVFTKSETDEIINSYLNGDSIETIRKVKNCSWDVIKKLLLENNVIIRNISEQKCINDKKLKMNKLCN